MDDRLPPSGKDNGPPNNGPVVPPPAPPGPPRPPGPPPAPPAPPVNGLFITNQPPGEIELVAVAHDLNKADLNSVAHQLQSTSLLARWRVWFAKLGAGAHFLDTLEKHVLELNGASTISIMILLGKLVRDAGLEREVLEDITRGAIAQLPNVDLAAPMSRRAVGVSEQLLRNEMSVGGSVAMEMFDAWVRRAVVPARPMQFSTLNDAIEVTPGFLRSAKAFEDRIRQNVEDQGKTGQIHFLDLQTGRGPLQPARVPDRESGHGTGRQVFSITPELPDLSLGADRVAKICIGSFQGGTVFMNGFFASPSSRSFTCKLRYNLIDHFGVDDDDCEISSQGIHGTPGQVAMWVLQHFAPSGHKPFIDDINVTRIVTGRF